MTPLVCTLTKHINICLTALAGQSSQGRTPTRPRDKRDKMAFFFGRFNRKRPVCPRHGSRFVPGTVPVCPREGSCLSRTPSRPKCLFIGFFSCPSCWGWAGEFRFVLLLVATIHFSPFTGKWFTCFSLHSRAPSTARRLILSIHISTWQSRANASLIHSIHANRFTSFTREVATKVRAYLDIPPKHECFRPSPSRELNSPGPRPSSPN